MFIMEEINIVSNDQFEPQYVYDTHGNAISLNSVLHFRRQLELSPPEKCCKICFKPVKKGDCHSECNKLLVKLEKARQKVVCLEFQLFCMKNTSDDPVSIEVV